MAELRLSDAALEVMEIDLPGVSIIELSEHEWIVTREAADGCLAVFVVTDSRERSAGVNIYSR